MRIDKRIDAGPHGAADRGPIAGRAQREPAVAEPDGAGA